MAATKTSAKIRKNKARFKSFDEQWAAVRRVCLDEYLQRTGTAYQVEDHRSSPRGTLSRPMVDATEYDPAWVHEDSKLLPEEQVARDAFEELRRALTKGRAAARAFNERRAAYPVTGLLSALPMTELPACGWWSGLLVELEGARLTDSLQLQKPFPAAAEISSRSRLVDDALKDCIRELRCASKGRLPTATKVRAKIDTRGLAIMSLLARNWPRASFLLNKSPKDVIAIERRAVTAAVVRRLPYALAQVAAEPATRRAFGSGT